jgi:oligopeptide/dipeptide ABC transporter ATP-binding protein
MPLKNTMQEQSTIPIPILKTCALCKDFPPNRLSGEGIRAIDHIDLEVMPGEVRGIIGESGAGKTVLARCSLQLIEPSGGSVHFGGQDLASLDPASLRAKRREFQMVFQDPYASLNPSMTVEEILLEPFHVHRIGTPESQHRRLRELLDAVSLSTELLKRKSGELSGGQQQRVGIARGLALKPRLLIADEPISALDASVQAQILNLLADLRKQYVLTLILISHSLPAIHYLCSHISVMYRGRIVEEAPAAIFFENPQHPYSRILLNTLPALDPNKQNHANFRGDDIEALSNRRSGCAFYPYCPHRLSICKDQTPHLTEIHPGEKAACFLYSQENTKQSYKTIL